MAPAVMEEPAWKRAGLKRHRESDEKVGNKRADETQPKPPKRVKLPKNERPPPPEPDQLAYLREYSEDRANWKFSKQKQNWILRHLFNIDEKYDKSLLTYLDGMQGRSKDRVVEDARKMCDRWNEFMRQKDDTQAPDKVEPEAAKKGRSDKSQESPQPVTDVQAKRARSILSLLTGSSPDLEFLTSP